jgi:hypothetical protein
MATAWQVVLRTYQIGLLKAIPLAALVSSSIFHVIFSKIDQSTETYEKHYVLI